MNYLLDIYKLSYTKRYSNVPRLHDESVAEHGFFVAAIVLDLHSKYKFDIGKAMIIAIAHDMTEIELNDCPWIIKKEYPEIAEAYKICEAKVAEKLPKLVAWGANEFDRDDKSIEAKIVHLADAIQCLQYSKVEVELGNKGYMLDVYEGSANRIKIIEQGLKDYERK